MTFQPRSFDEILSDMVAYVQANSTISDFNVGSVTRTILEAAALEDDEQYFQMQQLLEAFRLTTARGEELDRRLADFGLFRREATTAIVRVRFFNKNLTTDQLSQDELSGSSTITVFDSTRFPTTGFPYTVRIGEGTSSVQDRSVTANNTSTGTLTLSAVLTADVSLGDRVSLVSGTSSYTINSGTQVQSPATVSEPTRQYTTQEPAFILAGNFFSNEVLAKSQQPGTVGNVAAKRINQFVSSPPFTGAGVINFSAASGGSSRETDSKFRERALLQLQSLSRGTPLAVRTAAIGVVDQTTGQQSVSANIVEDFVNDEVIVYVDDGTGLIPDTKPLSSSTINNGGILAPGASALVLDSVANFPSSGSVLILENSGYPAELVNYVSKNNSTNTLTLDSVTTGTHPDTTVVLYVDVITTASESGRRRFSFQNFPVVRGSDRLFYNPGSSWMELSPGTDYVLNKGTGELQLTDTGGSASGGQFVAYYTYYTNLISAVQRTLEGDLDSPILLPGVKAAGIFLSVEAPTIRRISVVMSISADSGFREQDLLAQVRQQVEGYISSLRIGEDVVRSKIIDVAFNVRGIKDVYVSLPSANVAVLENELPVPYDTDGNSLVTIL